MRRNYRYQGSLHGLPGSLALKVSAPGPRLSLGRRSRALAACHVGTVQPALQTLGPGAKPPGNPARFARPLHGVQAVNPHIRKENIDEHQFDDRVD